MPSDNRRTLVAVDEAEASGQAWRDEVRRRGTVEQDRVALAQLVDWDADPFEVELYELACEPQELLIDRAQRSRAGQYERHVRRLRQRRAHQDCAGKRLFPDGSTPATFKTEEQTSRVLPGGVIALTVSPTAFGTISAGAYIIDDGRSATDLA